MSVPCPGCRETSVEHADLLCMKCKDAGLTLTPDPAIVEAVRAEMAGLSRLEEALFRIRENRSEFTQLAAHRRMRRENGHTLGAIPAQIAACDRDFVAVSKELRSLEKHNKESFAEKSNEERFELLAKWLEQAPFEHVRQFMAKAVNIFKQRSGTVEAAPAKKLALVPEDKGE